MARVAGVDIPDNKKVEISLQYLYGIGPTLSQKVLAKADVNPAKKLKELSDEELNRIREVIDKGYRVEGDLRKEVSTNIKRLSEIGSYRGIRHRRGLPVWGQRTQTNARTKRGPRKTVAGRGRRRGARK